MDLEDEGWLNSPTCIVCGWHPEDEGHDDDCPVPSTHGAWEVMRRSIQRADTSGQHKTETTA